MIVNCYSIFDTKSLTYSNPFYAPTDGAAVRIVSDASNDMNTSLGRHPADYVLYKVGSFNDANGILQHLDPREHVIDVVALVHAYKPGGDLFGKNIDTAHDANGKA